MSGCSTQLLGLSQMCRCCFAEQGRFVGLGNICSVLSWKRKGRAATSGWMQINETGLNQSGPHAGLNMWSFFCLLHCRVLYCSKISLEGIVLQKNTLWRIFFFRPWKKYSCRLTPGLYFINKLQKLAVVCMGWLEFRGGKKRFSCASHLPAVAWEYLFWSTCTPFQKSQCGTVMSAVDSYFPHCFLTQTLPKSIKSLCGF